MYVFLTPKTTLEKLLVRPDSWRIHPPARASARAEKIGCSRHGRFRSAKARALLPPPRRYRLLLQCILPTYFSAEKFAGATSAFEVRKVDASFHLRKHPHRSKDNLHLIRGTVFTEHREGSQPGASAISGAASSTGRTEGRTIVPQPVETI